MSGWSWDPVRGYEPVPRRRYAGLIDGEPEPAPVPSFVMDRQAAELYGLIAAETSETFRSDSRCADCPQLIGRGRAKRCCRDNEPAPRVLAKLRRRFH